MQDSGPREPGLRATGNWTLRGQERDTNTMTIGLDVVSMGNGK